MGGRGQSGACPGSHVAPRGPLRFAPATQKLGNREVIPTLLLSWPPRRCPPLVAPRNHLAVRFRRSRNCLRFASAARVA
jgi:hypothetical protein